MTRPESDEEIRQAIQARRTQRGQPAAATDPDADVQPDQPVQRPPMALLCILDDGKSDGEWVRLRADRTVIGRTDGDVRIPHDGLMSGRHAEIVRQPTRKGFRWILLDLGSTNGCFVRVGSTVLRHESELIVGRGRYLFEAACGTVPGDETADGTTRPWSGAPLRPLVPSLVEITPAGPVERFPLTLPEYWIGRDARTCAVVRQGDVLTSPRHARLYREADGRWYAENNKSLNGLWLRVDEIPLGKACQIRLGEQKFLFRIC